MHIGVYRLVVAFMAVCVLNCGRKPRGDSAVLPDGEFGGVEAVAYSPVTGRPVKVHVLSGSHADWKEARLLHRHALPAGERVLTFRVGYDTIVETVISVLPDTLVQIAIEMPAPGHGSRLIPDERCAVIKGTVTAGNTGRPMAGVTVRNGYREPVRSDSLGHFRLVLPGSRHHLQAWCREREASIDTFVAPGESAVIDLRMQVVLLSRLLFALGKMKPEPRWRVPVRDGTPGDSDIIRAVENWIELTERESDDTLAAHTFAAFELFGIASRGKWLTAYGRERHVECFAGGPKYKVGESWPCLLSLLRLGGRWVAMESWREGQNVNTEDMFPVKYRKLLRLGGRPRPDPLKARIEAKVAQWKRRLAESQIGRP
jgi:hypothetical protein